MPRELAKVESSLKRYFRRLVVATVIVYFAIAGIAFRTAIESHKINSALCALKTDLESRVTQSEQFIRQHPNGFGGIPVSAIRISVMNEKHTIDALHILDC